MKGPLLRVGHRFSGRAETFEFMFLRNDNNKLSNEQKKGQRRLKAEARDGSASSPLGFHAGLEGCGYQDLHGRQGAFAGRTPEEAYYDRLWRHEIHHGIPPNNRRQTVQRLGSTSVG